jgi:predicted lysophospholipase L1 biosynthesis ABC-type transport system permease subunit
MLAGRTFDARDRADGVRVIVVSASFARRYWPEARLPDVLGRRILLGAGGTTPVAVVGIVGDVRQTSLDAEAAPTMYFPVAQSPYPFLTFVVRMADGSPAAAALPLMRQALRTLDPALALHDVRPLEAVVDASLARQRFAMAVAGGFAAVALLLAAVGLYGVIAYSVAQRSRELGLRLALGATKRDVLGLVLGEGVRLTAVGVLAGLAGAFAAARLLRSQLYAVSPSDAAVYVGVALLTAAVALAATYMPARRATGIDPAVTLRGE